MELGVPHGPDLGANGEGGFHNVDLLPLGKTLGIKQGIGRRKTGVKKPRELNVTKLINKGFPHLSKKEGGI